MANSFLDPQGLYDPRKRFAFTNITDEIFTSYWDKVPINVKPHETIEISVTTPIVGVGHALAIKMTGELVNKIMMDEAKLDELAHQNVPYYRSPKGGAWGIPNARKVWEDKILRELNPDEESPAIQAIRNQMKKEILTGEEKQNIEPVKVPTSIEEFADITKKTESEVKAPAKIKKLGRPKKNATPISTTSQTE